MKTAAQLTTKKAPKCRAPNGVNSIDRISVALMPDERAELIKRAAEDGRTNSAMARVYMVRGMKADPLFNAEVLGEKQS
jgi:hypothetical protein